MCIVSPLAVATRRRWPGSAPTRPAGPVPLAVSFDGRGSSDPDGGDTIASYSWDLYGDRAFGDATTATATHTYTTTTPGSYTARLRVTDSRGLASDPQDGMLAATRLSWSLILHHCATPTDCHTHEIQDFNGVASGSFSAPDHEYPAWIELRLTATNSGGLTGTTSVRLDPQTVDLTFRSNPTGLQLTVGSSASTTPLTRTVIVGSRNTITAPLTQTVNGTGYEFVS